MVVARIIDPGSKLTTAREVNAETAASSLGLELDVPDVTEDDFYAAMDWLLRRQQRIERKLAKKHLRDGTLVLYDVSSSYVTGTHCALAAYGYSRDRKKDFPQIVYGLLCAPDGCPLSVQVFSGNTSDPNTLASQIRKVRQRFSLSRVVLVGDRGMITSKRIEQELRGVDGLDWISALRSSDIRKLVDQGIVQPTLFDDYGLAEVSSDDFPGERLMVCKNPLLADERARKREELLQVMERDFEKIAAATRREKRALRGKDTIGQRVGRVIERRKMAKHFILEIAEHSFTYRRDEQSIADEARLDGLYVVRTSVPADVLSGEGAVRAYKSLSQVERAFRSLKTVDLKVRPIYHRRDDRVRAHVFLCMLAYYVEWHMRQALAPLLFDDHDRLTAESARPTMVAPAQRSTAAKNKDATHRTEDDLPVQSFQSMLKDLATLTKNQVRTSTGQEFHMLSTPTPSQRAVLDRLHVKL
jgi:hypothetical protein